MRYLKTFENINPRYYWRVPTGNKLEIALNKIGVTQSFIDKLTQKKFPNKYIYVGQYKTSFMSSYVWGWDNIDVFKETNAIYNGEVEVEDWEIKQNKYNL